MTVHSIESFDKAGYDTLKVLANADAYNYWTYNTIKTFINGSVLELGSGIGNISMYILKDFNEVVLSDYNPDYCIFLKEKFATDIHLKDVVKIDLQEKEFQSKYFSYKEKFDTIILLNVIEHLAEDAFAIENCKYLLKENGHFIVLAPASKLLYSKFDKKIGHYRRYTLNSLQNLVSNSEFEIIHTQYFNFLGMLGWFVSKKLFKKEEMETKEIQSFNKLVPVAKFLDKIILNKAGLSAIVIGRKQ